MKILEKIIIYFHSICQTLRFFRKIQAMKKEKENNLMKGVRKNGKNNI